MLWEDFLARRKKRLEQQQRMEQAARHPGMEPNQHDELQRATFISHFREKIEQVIMPAFGKCVQSLTRYGIEARQVDRMNRVHPNVSLDIRYDPRHHCMFQLVPLETEGKVALRTLIHKDQEWNYEDATRVEVDQLSESLIREKVQEAIDVMDEH